jgi:spore germination protein KC
MRRKNGVRAIMVGLALVLLLTGCWNRRELNALSVVLAMGIDKVGEQYVVTLQIVDPTQMSQNRVAERSPVVTFTQRSATIFEALRRVTTKASRRMYVAHLRLLVFNEKAAREGINDIVDFVARDHEFRPDFYIAIAKGSTAQDLLELTTPTEVLPAMELYKSLKVSQRAWAPTAAVNIIDFLQKITKTGVEPVLTGVTITGNIQKGKSLANVSRPKSFAEFKYVGIGVMKDDRLIGWLDENESKAFNYITNNIRSTVGIIDCPRSDGKFNVEVIESKVKIVPSVRSGEPYALVKTSIEANVSEIGCNVDLTKEAELLKLQAAASDRLKEILLDSIAKVQRQYGADIFGFGEAFHRKYPSHWHRWRTEWDQHFKTMQVEVSMDYKLRKIGKIINPFDNVNKE